MNLSVSLTAQQHSVSIDNASNYKFFPKIFLIRQIDSRFKTSRKSSLNLTIHEKKSCERYVNKAIVNRQVDNLHFN